MCNRFSKMVKCSMSGYVQLIVLGHPTAADGNICANIAFPFQLELPAAISIPSGGPTTSNGNSKPPSTVSTVELAHSIIATMFQQPAGTSNNDAPTIFEQGGSVQLSTTGSVQSNDAAKAPPLTMAPTFVMTEQSDPKSNMTMTAFKITAEPRMTTANSHAQQRYVPAGITVTPTTTAADRAPLPQTPASVASRKRTSSASASQSRQRQQSLSLSKDAPSSTGNAGSASGEDEGDDIYIDTKELCNRIAYELKAHSIPQAVFAERVLCRYVPLVVKMRCRRVNRGRDLTS